MNDHEPGVETLFWGALQQPSPGAQAAYLDRACGDDKQLRRRLDCLLAAYRSGAEFLEQPAPSVGRLRDQIDGPPSSVSTSALRTLGDYRILREVGRGGMGVVYEAEQISLNRRVALKVLPFASVLDQRQLQRFKNEARAAASLDHPNIVRVHQTGCERGVHYYAMQYVEGRTLAELIAELRRNAGLAEGDQLRGTASRNVPPISGVETTIESQPPAASTPAAETDRRQQAQVQASTQHSHGQPEYFRSMARLGIQAAEALEHAHQMGVVHRDVKPSNLMVDSDGHLWVTDFGLATTQADTGLTMTGDVLGTLRYMSPEQAAGDRKHLDHRSDIYSLGVTLYELLALQPAIRGDDRHRLLRAIAEDQPVPLRSVDRHVPLDLETIVLKSTAKEPEDRYHTAGDLAEDLRRFLEYRPIAARRPSLAERGRKWARRHVTLVVSMLMVLLIGLVASTISFLLVNRAHQVAVEQRDAAREQKKQADGLREEAEEREAVLRRYLYSSDVRLAQRAWESADLSWAVELLSRHIPEPSQEDLRGFEWRYLWRLCHPAHRAFSGHDGDVYCLALSPGGRTLATAGKDGTVRLWDLADERCTAVLEGHSAEVCSVAFSPDGTLLASAGERGELKIWDVAAGTLKTSLHPSEEDMFSVAFSADGSLLACGGCDDLARLWDTATWELLTVLRGHTNDVENVTFSPDGKVLATAGADRMVRLWDAPSGEQRAQWKAHRSVLCVAFSSDGRLLATCGTDGNTGLWDITTGEELWYSHGHSTWVQCVAFSPDDRLVASAGKDGQVRLWDVRSGKPAGCLQGHEGRVWWAAFAPDGETLFTAGADGTIRLWDSYMAYRNIPADGLGVADVAFLPNAELLIFQAGLQGQWTWELRAADHRTIQHGSGIHCGAVSRSGRMLAVSDERGRLVLRDLATGAERLLTEYHGRIGHVGFSPDASSVVSAGEDQTVRLSDVATGRVCWTRTDQTIVSFAFAPDGRTLAVGLLQGVVELWDARTGQQRKRLDGGSDYVWSVAFSPGGDLLAIASNDNAIRICDAHSGVLCGVLAGHRDTVRSLAFSPDGKTLASGGLDSTVRLWNLSTFQELMRLEAHTGVVCSLTFSDDGKLLASGGQAAEGPSELFLWSAEPWLPGTRHEGSGTGGSPPDAGGRD